MPKATIWIRDEDLPRWLAITDRPKWIHHAITVLDNNGVFNFNLSKSKDLIIDSDTKIYYPNGVEVE